MRSALGRHCAQRRGCVRSLEADRSRDVYDFDKFVEYLKVPKPAAYGEERWLSKNQENAADLYYSCPPLPPVCCLRAALVARSRVEGQISDDNELVQDFLAHWFMDAKRTPDRFQRHVFAAAAAARALGSHRDVCAASFTRRSCARPWRARASCTRSVRARSAAAAARARA